MPGEALSQNNVAVPEDQTLRDIDLMQPKMDQVWRRRADEKIRHS